MFYTLLEVYQQFITVLTPAMCNYKITCSQYTKLAIQKHGFISGLLLAKRYTKQCSDDGISLNKIGEFSKHVLPGSQPPDQLPPMSTRDWLNVFGTITLTVTVVGIALGSVLLAQYGTSVFVAFIYLALIIEKKYCKAKSTNWIVTKVRFLASFLPQVIVSFPSMILAVLLKKLQNSLPNNKLLFWTFCSSLVAGSIHLNFILLTSVVVLGIVLTQVNLKPKATGRPNDVFSDVVLGLGFGLSILTPYSLLCALCTYWLSINQK
ncbi:MAG: membrane protein insertion efficiency factor YidD [Patescibacteria group bacterium]